MNDNNLHSVIVGALSKNNDFFNPDPRFQLLCHYAVNASPNSPDHLLDTLDINKGCFSRWLSGENIPLVLARPILAKEMLSVATEDNLSVTAYSEAFKPALSELFQRSAVGFALPELFQLACNVAHSYDPNIDRKVSDEFGLNFSAIKRWRTGRSAPQIFVRPTVIKGIGGLLNP